MSKQYPDITKEVRDAFNDAIKREMQKTDRKRILDLLEEFEKDFVFFYKKHGIDWNLKKMVFHYLREVKKILEES